MQRHSPSVSVFLLLATTLTATTQVTIDIAHFLTTELNYIPHPSQICNSTPFATPIPQQPHYMTGVLNGTIPSAVSNTSATSHALLPSAPSIPTGIPSKVVFHLPNGTTAVASIVNKLLHNVREPARNANIIPTLTNNSLISTSKFVDAGYTVIYNDKRSTIMRRPPPRLLCQRISATGMAMPTRQIVACPTHPRCSKLKH
jgi:hypothetical protein